MKKVMFASAALAAGFAMADITSANVVGYAQNEVNAGFSIKTISFLKVGSEKIDLTSVVPVSATYGGVDLDACASLMLINAGGAAIAENVYVWANWGTSEFTGWMLESSFLAPGDLELDPGTALWTDVNPMFTDLQFQCSGQVIQKTVKLPVVKGFSIGGNPFPVPYDITCAYPTSDTYAGVDLDSCVSMMKISAAGASISENVYVWSNWDSPETTGWTRDGAFLAEGDLVLGVGESLWLDNGNIEDLYLNFPCMIGEK